MSITSLPEDAPLHDGEGVQWHDDDGADSASVSSLPDDTDETTEWLHEGLPLQRRPLSCATLPAKASAGVEESATRDGGEREAEKEPRLPNRAELSAALEALRLEIEQARAEAVPAPLPSLSLATVHQGSTCPEDAANAALAQLLPDMSALIAANMRALNQSAATSCS